MAPPTQISALGDDAAAELLVQRLSSQISSMEARMQAKLDKLAAQIAQRQGTPVDYQELEQQEGQQVAVPEPDTLKAAGATEQVAGATNRGDNAIELAEKSKRPSAARAGVDVPLLSDKDDDEDDEPYDGLPRDTCLQRFIQSFVFNLFMFCVIMVNVVNTIITTDHYTGKLFDTTAPREALHYTPLEVFCLLCYIVELAMRIVAFKTGFWYNWDWGWNILDLLMVIGGIFDWIFTATLGHSGILMQLLAIARFLRFFRLFPAWNFMQELRNMGKVCFNCIGILCLACSLVVFFCIAFAMVFVQFIALHVGDVRDVDPALVNDINPNLKIWFDSVHTAAMKFFELCTQGQAWGPMYDVILWEVGYFQSYCFVAVVIFFKLAVLNIITSTFVRKTIQVNTPTEEELIQQRRAEETKLRTKLTDLVHNTGFDKDATGGISLEELRLVLKDPQIKKHFELYGVKVKDIEGFFRSLNARGHGKEVPITEFVSGCMKFKGGATALDVQTLRLDNINLLDVVRRIEMAVCDPNRAKGSETII